MMANIASCPLGAIDHSSFEALRPATGSRDPEILLNAQHDCTETDRPGSRKPVAGRSLLDGQQTLALPVLLSLSTQSILAASKLTTNNPSFLKARPSTIATIHQGIGPC